MAALKLAWTPTALADLASAREYLAAERPSAPDSAAERLERALKALTDHPEIGRPGRLEGTKELIVVGTPFIIPYRVRGNKIEILAFLHGARRWPESL